MNHRYTGRCLCGGIRFEVTEPLAPIQVCHCGQCRQAQGGPFATNIPVKASAFELQAGADLITAYESSPGKTRSFCRRCGSPLFSQRASLPGVLRLRAGTLEGHVPTSPGMHIYYASRANWWPSDDALPKHDTMPPAA
jgi:hypothetical protein